MKDLYIKRPLIFGLCLGIVSAILIQFLPFKDIIKGTFDSLIFVSVLIIMLLNTKPTFKNALFDFLIFIVADIAGQALITFVLNDYDIIQILAFTVQRTIISFSIGLIISLSRKSKKLFLIISSFFIILFLGTITFAIFNKEKVQELIEFRENKQLEVRE